MYFLCVLSKNESIYIPDLCTKTPCFLDRIWLFNGAENWLWCRINVVVFENWFGVGYYGDGDKIWLVYEMLLIFHYQKFEPYLVITIPYCSFYIVGKTIILCIVKCPWLWICYKCKFIRVCFQQQLSQSSTTECLTFLCPVYINRVLSVSWTKFSVNKR